MIEEKIEELGRVKETIIKFAKTYGLQLLWAVIVLVVGYVLIKVALKILKTALKKSKVEPTAHTIILAAARISLFVLLVITAASMLGIPTTTFVTVVGAVGLALSLAVKDSLANLAGGLIMLFSKPFVVGDYIAAEGFEGTVQEVNILHTKLLTPDNKQVFIPNGQMSNAKVVNYTGEPVRRLDMNVGIGYQDDFQKAQADILELVAQNPLALKEPQPVVRMVEHGDSAVVVCVRVWTKTEDYWPLNFDLHEQIKARFDKDGISIPYQQISVSVEQASALTEPLTNDGKEV